MNNKEDIIIGNNIRKYRLLKRKDLYDVYAESGIPVETLMKYEDGMKSVTYEDLLKISRCLRVKSIELVEATSVSSKLTATIGNNIKIFRERKGMNLQDVIGIIKNEDREDVSLKDIKRIESGKFDIAEETVAMIVKALDVSLDKLLDDKPSIKIADKIRIYRERREYTKRKLADELGISVKQLEKYENGEEGVEGSLIEEIVRILDVAACSLITSEEHEEIPEKSIYEVIGYLKKLTPIKVYKIEQEVIDAYNQGVLIDYTINITQNQYKIVIVDEENYKAVLSGEFNKEYKDFGGFMDMMNVMRWALEMD